MNQSWFGSHQQPDSAMPNFRPGWRSKAPDQSRNHRGRAGHQVTSLT
ncbi:hypothetical protein SSPIM334S_05453 [Streptomyces spiroverticillatus]